MQKLFLCLLGFSFFVSCNNKQTQNIDNFITVSIRPQKYIVEQISGDKFKIKVLVPDGSGPETYEPTSRQLREISQSKMYISTGLLDFENSWLPKVQELYPNLDIVNSSEGISLIDDHHEHDHRDGEIEKSDDNHDKLHTHSIHAGIDPHIWLSINTIIIQANNIKNSLSKLDPDHADYYKRNFAIFLNRLDSLDKAIRQQYTVLNKAVSFVIYHPSLGYYCRDYSIEQLAIEMEGKEPSPAYLRELIDLIKEKNITTVFYSNQFDKRSAETIAKQLKIPLTPINPLAENVEKNILEITEKIIASQKR